MAAAATVRVSGRGREDVGEGEAEDGGVTREGEGRDER